MPAMINLGGAYYVVKTAAQAAQVIKLLEHALRVNPEWDDDSNEKYFKPAEHDWETRITMETVRANQLRLPAQPVYPERDVRTGFARKRAALKKGGQLLLGNGGVE
jgi:hypothetical protein